MQLSIDQVKHLAGLAKLDFSAEELERLAADLAVVLEYFQQLSEVDTSGVRSSARAVAGREELREDVVRDSLGQESALANAAGNDGEFFLVPRVMKR